MSNSLYMNTEAANQALMEMKEYNEEKAHLFTENIARPTIAANESKPWVANSYNEFCNLCVDRDNTKRSQNQVFEDLIARLQKEIRQWEETSQKLGS